MAFVTTQTGVVVVGGNTPGVIKVYGTYLSSAGGTGGVISPGYTNSSGTLTAVSPTITGNNVGTGAIKMLFCNFTPTSNDATAPGAAIAFNSTRDRDEATIVTTADTGGIYELTCLVNG